MNLSGIALLVERKSGFPCKKRDRAENQHPHKPDEPVGQNTTPP